MVVAFLSRFPLPPVGGTEKLLLQYLGFLSSAGVPTVVFSFSRKKVPDVEIASLQRLFPNIRRVVIAQPPCLLEAAFHFVWSLISCSSRTVQEALYLSRSTVAAFRSLVTEVSPECILFDLLRTAQYASFGPRLGKRPWSVFCMQDLFSRRYEAMRRYDGPILGALSEHVPPLLRLAADRLLRGTVLTVESQIARRRELALTSHFDLTYVVSPAEAHALRLQVAGGRVEYLYPAADRVPLYRRGPPPERTIGYMGFLGTPANNEGLLWFLRRVLPLIVEQTDLTQFLVVGRGASREVEREAARFGSLCRFVGYVEDYATTLANTRVFVAPINFGTGIKTKVIDAMSLGIPVVCTPCAAEGLLAQDTTDILVADGPAHFCRAVVSVLNNDGQYRRLSLAATKYAELHHSRDALCAKFLSFLRPSAGVA